VVVVVVVEFGDIFGLVGLFSSSNDEISSIIIMLTGTAKKGLATKSTKSRAGGGRINSVAKLYNQLKRTAAASGSGSAASEDAGASTAKRSRKAATVKLPATEPKIKPKNLKVKSKVRPSWFDYERALDLVDDLKIQLPFLGADRLCDQYYKLIDPPDDLGAVACDEVDWPVSNHSSDSASGSNASVGLEPGAAAEEGSNDEIMDNYFLQANHGRAEDMNNLWGPTAESTDAMFADIGPDNSSNFYHYSFDEIVKRFVLRALVSPFDIDAEYQYGEEETANMQAPEFQVYTGMESYLERAVNLFGKQAANMLQFRQVRPFLLQNKDGSVISFNSVTASSAAAAAAVSAASSSSSRVGGNGGGIGGRSGGARGAGGSAKTQDARRQRLINYHQDCFKRVHEMGLGVQLSFNDGGAACGCCLSATRLCLIDFAANAARPEDQQLLQLTRSLQQSHVLFNIHDVLYRWFASADELQANFNIRQAYRGLKNREQSRCSVLKTERVQRMSFYRRIYAVHAALFALVNWLWYRQTVRHRHLYNSQQSVDDEIPPVILMLSRRLAPMFVKVRTVFMELLLQKRRVLFQYV
jgi:hypothetical protein